MHKWFKYGLLIAVIFPFSLVWGEIFTRILLPQNVDSQMNISQSDNVIGLTYKPGAMAYEKGREYNVLYKINSFGLRDREYGPKKKSVFRVILLGDSFSVSHGLPIENSLSRQLERALQSIVNQDRINLKIEVINAARDGYSPFNYWKSYSRWKAVFNPDLVIVGLSPDDFDSSNAYMHYVVENGNVVSIYKEGQKPIEAGIFSISRIRKWLSWNSEFYVLLRNYFYYNSFTDKFRLLVIRKNIDENNQLSQYIVPQSNNMKRSWTESFYYLRKLKQETDKDNVCLIIMSIPRKLEIDSGEYRRILAESGLAASQLDIEQPLNQITGFCREESIPLLDTRMALRKCNSETPCYFIYDGHWIAEGIRVACDSVVLQWRDLHLPPWRTTESESIGK